MAPGNECVNHYENERFENHAKMITLPSLVIPLNFRLIYLLSVKLMEIIVKSLLSFSDKLALLTRR